MIDPEWLSFINNPDDIMGFVKPGMLIAIYHWSIIRNQIKSLNDYKSEIHSIHSKLESLEKSVEMTGKELYELRRDFKAFVEKFVKT